MASRAFHALPKRARIFKAVLPPFRNKCAITWFIGHSTGLVVACLVDGKHDKCCKFLSPWRCPFDILPGLNVKLCLTNALYLSLCDIVSKTLDVSNEFFRCEHEKQASDFVMAP